MTPPAPAGSPSSMHWGIVWNFKGDGRDQWLDDVARSDRHRFTKIATNLDGEDWHQRTSTRTPVDAWLRNLSDPLKGKAVDGVITVFPPKAATVGINNRLRRRPLKHVAWAFNLGHHPQGWRRWAGRFALGHVDRIIVHSSGEVPIVRDLFGLREGQVEFVHLQGPDRPVLASEDREQPFISSIGSANRDYPTLIEALRRTGLPAKIVAAPRLVERLKAPPNVELMSGLTHDECLRLTQRSRLSVTPLDDAAIASGQVTIIDALTMGRPVVTTRSLGTTDYVVDDETGVLTQPHDVDGLADAMQRLWDDEAARHRIALAGQHYARSTLSDEAIAARFLTVLDQVAAER